MLDFNFDNELNLYKYGKITKGPGDKENSFGKVVNFLKNMIDCDKEIIRNKFNDIHDTGFNTNKTFIDDLYKVVGLRNFCLHHYSIVSYEYASIIKNGEAHVDKNGKNTSLNETMKSLSNFINKKSANTLIQKIKKIITKYPFSSKTIKDSIILQMENILNFKALKSIKRENIHYSIIDLIKTIK
jgi:hypothetical protein